MRIYACYSPSHRPLMERHFLPSIPIDCDVVLRRISQACPSGVYHSDGWASAMAEKIYFIKESIFDGHEPLVYSDVDVRFYGSFIADALDCLGDADLAIQDDGEGGLCSGFFVLRPGRHTYRLLQRSLELVPEHGCDQPAMNAAIKEMQASNRIEVVTLPGRYWTHGRAFGIWDGSTVIEPPADLLVHHANWCVGLDRKMALLDMVAKQKGIE